MADRQRAPSSATLSLSRRGLKSSTLAAADGGPASSRIDSGMADPTRTAPTCTRRATVCLPDVVERLVDHWNIDPGVRRGSV